MQQLLRPVAFACALAATPFLTQAQTYSFSEADGQVTSPPGTQVMINTIPRAANTCAGCIIDLWDSGFANISFFHAMPSAGLQEIRLVARIRMDELRQVRAPNGQGGTEFVTLAELGIEQRRSATVEFTMEVVHPETGEVRQGRAEFSIDHGQTIERNASVTVGGDWGLTRAREESRTASAANARYKFRVTSVRWTEARYPFLSQVDQRVRARLRQRGFTVAADGTVSRTAAQGAGAASQPTGAGNAGGASTPAVAPASAPASSATPATSETGARPASAGTGTRPAMPPSARPSSGVVRDSATDAREAEAGRAGTAMIDEGRRQGEADRARRQREADALVAAAAPAAIAVASMLGELLPPTTFGMFGIGGQFGTNGSSFYFDGGPGWRLTPRGSRRHLAVSPGLIFGWNSPTAEDFEFQYRDVGDPGPSPTPAQVNGNLMIGLGGSIFFDIPWRATAVNLSVHRIWGGSDVEPKQGLDEMIPGSLLLRAELMKQISFSYALAAGLGYHGHTLKYSSYNGERERANNGVFVSFRLVNVQR